VRSDFALELSEAIARRRDHHRAQGKINPGR
jgi:hypothetical protein